MCIHEEGRHLALVLRGPMCLPLVPQKLHLLLGMPCEQRSVAGSAVAESAFQGDYKSDPQGVMTSWAYFLLWIFSSMHPSFSTFYGAPFLAPLSLVLKERGGREGAGGVMVPCTLVKTVVGHLSASIFHVSRMPTVLQF